jgi:hypothetical protein
MRRVSICLVAALSLTALSGCESARKALGIEKSPPDEFRIVSRAPLELPPDFSLRPPRAGAQRPQEATPTQRARQTVFRAGNDQPQAASAADRGGRSEAEMALLRQAHAGNADTAIRQTVDEETQRQAASERSFIDALLFWKKPEEPGAVVDAQKESQRLRENVALGKPVTEGETPTIERKRRGLLQGLF